MTSPNWRKPLFMAYFRLSRMNIRQKLREYHAIEFASPQELQTQNINKLKALLLHAYTNVPYYHDTLKQANVIENGKVNLDNFTNIPPLTKDIIREQGNRLISKDAASRRTYTNSSGGSTGEPITITQDNQYKTASWANKVFYNQMIGKEPGQKEVKLWGSERDIFKGSFGIATTLKNKFFNRLLLNSFKMSEADMANYIDQINTFKPIAIWSYIDSAHQLAAYIQDHNLTITPPKAIIVTAGTVTDKVKNFIQETFNAPVYNQYGSREAGDMACECPEQTGLHVFQHLYNFEIVNSTNNPITAPDTIGNILVTPLENYAMPLIRYQIGDTASWSRTSACPCKRPFPLINPVHGRITDHFLAPDNTIIHGEYFTHLFYFKPWLKTFQVRQTKLDHVICYIVPKAGSTPPKTDLEEIKDNIKRVLGENCEVTFETVAEIEPSSSGKYRYTISDIT